MTAVLHDGGAAIGDVYIHDLLVAAGNQTYDSTIDFSSDADSQGTIERVNVFGAEPVGFLLAGHWRILDCSINADDTAIQLAADADRCTIADCDLSQIQYDSYAIIVEGDNNLITGNQIGRTLRIVGDNNLIVANQFPMWNLSVGWALDKTGIRVEGDNNYITANTIWADDPGPGDGSVTTGIDIISGATGNIIGRNNLVDTTTPIVDAGTGTVLPPGMWRTWTPNYTNLTVGNGTVVARVAEIDGLIEVRYRLDFGSTTTIDGTGPTISLPVTASTTGIDANGPPLGLASMKEAGGAHSVGQTFLPSSTTFEIFVTNTAGTYGLPASVTATVPFTWGENDIFAFTATYEAA
jgi:hypothetical protein